MPDEQRRAEILATAEEIFVRKGYGGTSTDEIAARCRISKQTLYRLFPGKQDLFVAMAQAHSARMIDLAADYDDLPLDEALAKIFMIELDQRAYEVRATFLRALFTESLQHPEFQDSLKRRAGARTRAELTAWLDRQCRKRGLTIADTASAAHMLMDVFTGSVIFDAVGGFGWSGLAERSAHFRQCIAIVLRGIAPVPAR
jgi:AcrR family transcriptional regulator